MVEDIYKVRFENIIGTYEAHLLTGYAESTLKDLCAARKLPSKKIGKSWAIDRSSEEFLSLYEKRKFREIMKDNE